MKHKTLSELEQALRSGQTTSGKLMRESFERIDDPRGEGARVFIRLFRESAAATAEGQDALRAARVRGGPLAGIPVSVKDLCDVAGSVTTAGSVLLKDAAPAEQDAPVVARLRAAGAVIVGTTNMTEFAMGGPGINPHYGTPLNPFDRKTGRLPGGSSAGAAVSVADGMVAAALGTDTAGSIQMPAAFCGLTGFKPTAARVPMERTIPLAPSMDSIGPLANTVACCAAMDAVLAGESDFSLRAVSPQRLRFGVPQTLVLDDLDPQVAAAFTRALSALSRAGVQIVEIPFAELGELPAINAKGSLSVIEGYAWHRRHLEKSGHLYDPIVAGRFARGASVSAADYIDLCRARADFIARCARVTQDFDAIVMPAVPLTAPRLADFKDNEPLWLSTNLRMVRNPGVANFLDCCALSIPCQEEGAAPVGFSLMGRRMADRRLLAVGLAVEPLLAPGIARKAAAND